MSINTFFIYKYNNNNFRVLLGCPDLSGVP